MASSFCGPEQFRNKLTCDLRRKCILCNNSPIYTPNCTLHLQLEKHWLSHCFCSVAQVCLALYDPMHTHGMPGLPVPHYLSELTQVHVRCLGDAVQPSHPLTLSSPSMPNYPPLHKLGSLRITKLLSGSPSRRPLCLAYRKHHPHTPGMSGWWKLWPFQNSAQINV